MKLGRDEVLMVPYKCCCFRSDLSRVGSRAGQKKVAEDPILQRTSPSDHETEITNRLHSNDLEACGKKCCFFYSDVKGHLTINRASFPSIFDRLFNYHI